MISRIKPVSQEDFFRINAGKYTYEEFAEQVYLMIHTYYLQGSGKLKVLFGDTWRAMYNVEMSDETFEYMLVNAPIMLREIRIEQTKEHKEITSDQYLKKTLVAFEFDLWMVENFREGNELTLFCFESYLTAKYGSYLDDRYSSFKRYDLRHIKNFRRLAEGLDKHYDDIMMIFELIVQNNQARINIDNSIIKRTDGGIQDRVEKKNVVDCTGTGTVITDLKNEDDVKQIIALKSSDKKDAVVQPETLDTVKTEEQIRNEFRNMYQLIIAEKDERIEKLERDIKEYRRLRDEAREYSNTQYDRGVKNLFNALNDIRYGKVIDYLYALLQSDNIDDNLASYLDNLFMALEDMSIEPIVECGNLVVNEENMLKQFNLDFNKTEFDATKVRLKYAGWKYKDIIVEKPTITLGED